MAYESVVKIEVDYLKDFSLSRNRAGFLCCTVGAVELGRGGELALKLDLPRMQ